MTKKRDRRARAARVLEDLDTLRAEWNQETVSQDIAMLSRRERFKLLEAEVSVLRILQAESRLLQQLLLGLTSFIGGATATLLFKHLFGI